MVYQKSGKRGVISAIEGRARPELIGADPDFISYSQVNDGGVAPLFEQAPARSPSIPGKHKALCVVVVVVHNSGFQVRPLCRHGSGEKHVGALDRAREDPGMEVVGIAVIGHHVVEYDWMPLSQAG
jgi:hypothetical protein